MPHVTPASSTFRLISRTTSLATLSAVVIATLAGAPRTLACPPIDPNVVVDPAPDSGPNVRIALLLDTSNSMDGLIGQAKAQLWSIVNRFGRSCRENKRPTLHIALYEYGNNNISPGEGHVRQVLPFTRDLDLVSEKLFSLTTNGGQEYCGTAIQHAVKGLSWTKKQGDLSMIVIAGNEPFTQGDVHYSESIADAVKQGVLINTIFCGPRSEGVLTKWQDGAVLGRGSFGCINQDADVGHIPTPFDDEITRLGAEVNTTYLAYGAAGFIGKERQETMDQAQASLPASARRGAEVERSVAKNSAQYSNIQWDLVDAVQSGGRKVADLKDEELPAELKSMSVAQREQHVQELVTRRADINRRVQELQTRRLDFIEKQRANEAKPGAETLGDALLAAIRQQATDVGYEFD
jgi:hypothetical protein